MRGGKQVIVEPHRHSGVFIARGKEDALVTINMVPGDAVYGEKRIAVEASICADMDLLQDEQSLSGCINLLIVIFTFS